MGPEHAWLHDQKRVEYAYATDDAALDAFMRLARLEGIIPALESSHAVAECIQRPPKMPKDSLIIVNLSGRGDRTSHRSRPKMNLQMPKWGIPASRNSQGLSEVQLLAQPSRVNVLIAGRRRSYRTVSFDVRTNSVRLIDQGSSATGLKSLATARFCDTAEAIPT